MRPDYLRKERHGIIEVFVSDQIGCGDQANDVAGKSTQRQSLSTMSAAAGDAQVNLVARHGPRKTEPDLSNRP